MRIVIVGGVAAGMSAASRARRQNPDADIVVFEAGEFISYAACGLPYALGGEVEGSDFGRLVIRTPGQMRQRGISVRLGCQAEGVDARAGTVTVRGPDGATRAEPYDRLLLATGAEPVRPPFAQTDLQGVHVLKSIPDAQALDETLRDAQRVCIVGGGYIGLEMAEMLRQRGLSVVLVERMPEVASILDEPLRAPVRAALERGGVDVRTGVSVSGLTGHGRVTGVQTDAGLIRADTVLVAVGIRPRTELARAAGVTLGASGAIAVNNRQETDVPGISAAGDCAEALHRVTGRPVYIPLALTANRAGRVAGVNMAGGDATFPGIVGTGIFKTFELGIGLSGLTQAQAEQAGLKAASVDLSTTDAAGYHRAARPVHIRLTGEKGSGRLLGAQIVAEEHHAAKRIDVIAALLGTGASVQDLFDSDLAYAPPFSSTWDFPLVAADRLLRLL
ncbi:FAD-dependent oxidoreductase [Deinococcus sp. Marseille-Q6407]|uniref:FAD-dependent oxidoreductase n=1 Tax=Deinococcus sp. Marseille-Q6407 TaxID=2969223 RepID=UPI0021BE9D98|nr:FAD-dependent oxidoreductase [Deinococcus sp. Marseille-Q6407]